MSGKATVRQRPNVTTRTAEPAGDGGVLGLASKRVQSRSSWEAMVAAIACFILVRVGIKIAIHYNLLGIGLT